MLAVFLKIGTTGFGGGMALIAFMEREFVRKRKALTMEEFVHGVGLAQILGPFAVNTSIFIGSRLHGPLGGLAAAAALLTPCVSLVMVLAELYFRYHALPALRGAADGLGPVVIALIALAAWPIARQAVRPWRSAVIAVAAAAAGIAGVNAVWVLLAAAAAGLLTAPRGTITRAPTLAAAFGAAAPASPLLALSATFLKIGFVFFGGGFVLIPLLRDRLVTQLGWLTPQQFLDGVAISNLTPGPIAVLATFAGYHMAGVAGGLLSTAALFAPAAVLMLAIGRGYGRYKDDERVQRILGAINPAVAGLVLSAAVLLGRGALVSWRGWMLFAASLILLRWPPVVALAVGAAVGYFGFVP
jgi:chromate transporter